MGLPVRDISMFDAPAPARVWKIPIDALIVDPAVLAQDEWRDGVEQGA